MTKHLDRLLRRHGLDRSEPPSPHQWEALLASLDARDHARDRERYLTQRAQQLASDELAAATDEARRRAEELVAVLDTLSEGVCVVDADGIVRIANPSARWLFGRIEEGTRLRDVLSGLVDPHRDESLVDLVDDACRRRISLDIAHALLPGGTTRHLSIKGMPAPDEEVTVLSFVDISGLVAADASRADLERRIGHQQRLESIGRLAGSVAHDFNNLLAGIVSCVDLLEDDVTGNALEDVAEIRRSAKRGADLTRRLLAFSRQEPSDPVPVDVSAAVASLESLLRRLVERPDALRSHFTNLDCTVSCDPIDLEQVVMNLVLNARDAIDEHGQIVVETERVRIDPGTARHLLVSAGDYVLIKVSDDGVGMPDDVAARALDPFFTTKPAGEGNGLGLSTVQTLVARAGGTIRLYSEPGRGTTARVYLPAVRPARRRDDATDDQPAMSPTPSPVERGLRVLIVDDESTVLNQAARTVESLGHAVTPVRSAAQAIERLGDHDLVLCDVVLGDESGIALADELVRRRPDLTVVFMSGFSAEVLDEVPAGLLVEKPFSAAEIKAAFAAASFAAAMGPSRTDHG